MRHSKRRFLNLYLAGFCLLLAGCGGGGGDPGTAAQVPGDPSRPPSEDPEPDDPPPTEEAEVLASTGFHSGPNGWDVTPRLNGDSLTWDPDGGSDGSGALRWRHWSGGAVSYFAAPRKFLGKKAQALGGELYFEMDSGPLDDPTVDQPFLILEGPDGLRLAGGFSSIDSGWSRWHATLSASSGWLNVREERRATEEELRRTLTDLVDLRIRATTTATIDNVRLVAGHGQATPRDRLLVSSDFDDTRDGWGMERRLNGDSFSWSTTEGRRDGGLLWDHWSGGATNYFVAGSRYRGNRSSAYGGAVEFEVRSGRHEIGEAPLVKLEGAGLTLETGFEGEDARWLRYRATLDTRGGWIVAGEGRLARSSEIRQVLENLTNVSIRTISRWTVLDSVRLVGPGS